MRREIKNSLSVRRDQKNLRTTAIDDEFCTRRVFAECFIHTFSDPWFAL